jgi:hypothetical protein
MKSQDHALALIKAAINLVPFGGAVASLLGDYMPSYRERTTERAMVHAYRLNAQVYQMLTRPFIG